jgi:hypothetical protein
MKVLVKAFLYGRIRDVARQKVSALKAVHGSSSTGPKSSFVAIRLMSYPAMVRRVDTRLTAVGRPGHARSPTLRYVEAP